VTDDGYELRADDGSTAHVHDRHRGAVLRLRVSPPSDGRRPTAAGGSAGTTPWDGRAGKRAVRRHDPQHERTVTVLDGAAERGLTTVERTGPACDHEEAYWDIQQLRAGDESPTILTICTQCGTTDREESGSGASIEKEHRLHDLTQVAFSGYGPLESPE
jgi:DNA-directed RNA polymerase subunit M